MKKLPRLVETFAPNSLFAKMLWKLQTGKRLRFLNGVIPEGQKANFEWIRAKVKRGHVEICWKTSARVLLTMSFREPKSTKAVQAMMRRVVTTIFASAVVKPK